MSSFKYNPHNVHVAGLTHTHSYTNMCIEEEKDFYNSLLRYITEMLLCTCTLSPFSFHPTLSMFSGASRCLHSCLNVLYCSLTANHPISPQGHSSTYDSGSLPQETSALTHFSGRFACSCSWATPSRTKGFTSMTMPTTWMIHGALQSTIYSSTWAGYLVMSQPQLLRRRRRKTIVMITYVKCKYIARFLQIVNRRPQLHSHGDTISK